VTQPRVTCYRVGIRMSDPQMPALLVARHRPGFYFRVLEEGEVEAGDEIVKVADGPERLTVVDTDALLYLPGHGRSQLERALRVPALSPGWQASFQALLSQRHEGGWTGNAGIALDTGPSPAWQGFRSMRVAMVHRESSSVFSLEFEPTSQQPLSAAAPGQFVILRLPVETGRAPLLRSYSLSGPSGGPRYRISIKQEPHGAGGRYLHEHIRVGDSLDVAAPRGAFLLRPGSGQVVLLSAGIGATPVLAMLYTIAEDASTRSVWWVYGARNGDEHPFAREVSDLLQTLQDGRRHIAYSCPSATDQPGVDFDVEGHLDIEALRRLDISRDADFYLCGPEGFMRDMTSGLATWGVPRERIRTENFGPGHAITPGVVGQPARSPHLPAGPSGEGPQVSFARSGLNINWSDEYASLLELAEACDVTVRWSCRTGVCHTCVTSLLAGTVAYQPEPLERPGDNNVLICCGQPENDVALDL
jgi:ferredoxin-NADP reductase